MGYYILSPFKPVPKLLVAGRASYLLGSWIDRTGPTLGMIISDAAVTTTATLVFQINSGNAPVAGALITVIGAANSANFNVVNAVIITASTDMATGICHVTYAITSTSQGTLPDSGQVEIPQPENAVALLAQASEPVAVPFQNAQVDQGRAITAVVSLPTLPTTVTITLQQAVMDKDSEYSDLVTVASVVGGVLTGGQVTVEKALGRFFRFNASSLTGPASTIIAKILG